MKADYTPLNPRLDPRVVPLFPYAAHLHAFMRCVLFHPDYSPFISFEEQFPLATKIVNDHSGFILTVGDVIYYVACFVEKRNPAPPGVRRSSIVHPPRKISIQNTGIGGLLADDTPTASSGTNNALAYLTSSLKSPTNPEIDTQNALTSLYSLIGEDCAPPKETAAVKREMQTIQEVWEKSTSGTIRAEQFNTSKNPAHISKTLGRISHGTSFAFKDLCCDAPAQLTKPENIQSETPRNLSSLFAAKTTQPQNIPASPSEETEIKPVQKETLTLRLGNLFNKEQK